MRILLANAIRKLMKMDDNLIFSVEFTSREKGTVRKMVCRKGVKAGQVGGVLNYNPAEKELMPVFDVEHHRRLLEDTTDSDAAAKASYRMVNLAGLRKLKVNGTTYDVIPQRPQLYGKFVNGKLVQTVQAYDCVGAKDILKPRSSLGVKTVVRRLTTK